ncbi:MAG: ankyrin repeat domain-containing protein [Alteripontixanthobacter sp.]
MSDRFDDEPTPTPRYGLRGWFPKVRTRRWARLFLFEFLVVLLGVLSAQALANWLGERAEKDRAAQVKLALDTRLEAVSQQAMTRARSSACFHHRLDLLRRDLADEKEASVQIYRPLGRDFTPINWDGDTPALILKHYGRETAELYDIVNRLLESAAVEVNAEASAWNGFTRLTNQFGTPSAQDFASAKDDWLRAESFNHSLERTSRVLIAALDQLDISSDLSNLQDARESNDICVRALSYSLAEHAEAKKRNELVTGEDTSYQFFWSPRSREPE